MFSPKSSYQYSLLKKYLRYLEFKSLCDNYENASKAFLLKQRDTNKKLFKLIISLSNLKFLKKEEAKGNGLYCSYCDHNKERPLVIYDFKPSEIDVESYMLQPNKYVLNNMFNPIDGATVDHIIPLSLNGEPLDENNLTVCCHECNKRKSNKNPEPWIKILQKSQKGEGI